MRKFVTLEDDVLKSPFLLCFLGTNSFKSHLEQVKRPAFFRVYYLKNYINENQYNFLLATYTNTACHAPTLVENFSEIHSYSTLNNFLDTQIKEEFYIKITLY